MTAPARRLEAAAASLTARERAILILRPWLAGGEGDQQLRASTPPGQKHAVMAIEQAVRDWHEHLYRDLWVTTEWLHQESIQLELLLFANASLDRERLLSGAFGDALPVLPPLPPPGAWLERDLPLLYGKRAFEDPGPPPADWTEQRRLLIRGLVRTVALRWQMLAADRAVAVELGQVMGEPMLHRELAEAMDAIESKLRRMHEALQRFEQFALPQPTEEQLATAHDAVRWEAFTGPDLWR